MDDEDLRRDGFRDLSYKFMTCGLWAVAPEVAAGRVIATQLGNGAHLCAMSGSRSVSKTTRLTALDGLIASTRRGAIDPVRSCI